MNETTDQETVKIFNPLTLDFSYTWFDDHDHGHLLTLPSLQTSTWPKAQGNFMAKHLVDYIDMERGGSETAEIRREKIIKEIIK